MARKETVEAVKKALASRPKRNFSESVDLAINLKNIDMSQPKNRVDEDIILPSGLGKTIKVAVFAKGEVAVNAEKAGADYVFPPEEIEKLGADKPRAKKLASEVNFFIAETAYMPTIGKRLGTVLGPRGKMPAPLPPQADVTALITRQKKSIKIRSKDRLTFHATIGTETMTPEEIAENIDAIIKRLETKLEKGKQNIHAIYVKTTMGPAVKVM
ncbi:50S ribosomal protein L1 [Methanocella arvoryzae]|uniref:Large ribosomal subunit protein uL1 n=1 Tax=Methanocella arvoryzae (strain DSM 22066 / NBRC 105507 / MRE50) TaxID=351160 RepID=RL1_METAR|nr:50S ribosomal protein L1 [Methanocella arvoryzae]Q0W050.1 RecName: Full=Large ribosomal subunit protein uL1; AltName: Full=50S ribosomal protein L1 [Methanocella arvoryzae MRE50]CAJ38243.1 50S ribosomal protein L1P [Methanocella arvoryzae MRE50]